MGEPRPDWYDEGKKNRQRALDAVREFENKYTQGFLQGEPDYRNLAPDAKELREFVKGLRLLREDKDEVWGTLNKVIDEAFARRKNFQFNRKVKSGQSKEILFTILNHAEGYASGQTPDDFRKAQDYLNEARDKMKDRDHYPLIKEHHDEVWDKYQHAREKLHYRRQSIGDSNYSQAKSAAWNAVSKAESCEKLREGSEALKSAGECPRNPMSKEQRDEVRGILDRGWDKLKSRREEQQRDWERRQVERDQKHREWVQRQHDGISRLEGALEKTKDYAAHTERRIEDLRQMEYDARTSEHADRVRGWRGEAEDKLSDVRRSISELEAKIRDARSRLD